MEDRYIKFYCNDGVTTERIFYIFYNKIRNNKKYFVSISKGSGAIKYYTIKNKDTGDLIKIAHIDEDYYYTSDKPSIAYIDLSIDKDYITQCILPCCIYTNEQIYYFDEQDIENGFDIKF